MFAGISAVHLLCDFFSDLSYSVIDYLLVTLPLGEAPFAFYSYASALLQSLIVFTIKTRGVNRHVENITNKQ